MRHMEANGTSVNHSLETSQIEVGDPPKQRGYRFWLGCFVLLLGLPLLLYYGYCWGLWGRSSLLLQYLFQCSCPPASEEARYPDVVDVIISACRQSSVELSPSGRLLSVHEEQTGITSKYLLDLQTMERIDVSNQPSSSFLTDNIGFIESGLEDYLVDRTTGKQYSIQPFKYWRENAYVNGEPNLELLVSALQQAEQVFFSQSTYRVVVLMSNFPTSPEQNFTFDDIDIPGLSPRHVEQFLQENDIVHQTILPGYPHEVASPDGSLIARDDGIYLVATNQLIAQVPPSLVMGWTSDGRSVIYSSPFGRCLIRTATPFADEVGCATWVPQPVIILKVPEEYLLPFPHTYCPYLKTWALGFGQSSSLKIVLPKLQEQLHCFACCFASRRALSQPCKLVLITRSFPARSFLMLGRNAQINSSSAITP